MRGRIKFIVQLGNFASKRPEQNLQYAKKVRRKTCLGKITPFLAYPKD